MDRGERFEKGFGRRTGGGSTGVQNNQYFGGNGPATLGCGTMQVRARTKTSNRHFRHGIREHPNPRRYCCKSAIALIDQAGGFLSAFTVRTSEASTRQGISRRWPPRYELSSHRLFSVSQN